MGEKIEYVVAFLCLVNTIISQILPEYINGCALFAIISLAYVLLNLFHKKAKEKKAYVEQAS